MRALTRFWGVKAQTLKNLKWFQRVTGFLHRLKLQVPEKLLAGLWNLSNLNLRRIRLEYPALVKLYKSSCQSQTVNLNPSRRKCSAMQKLHLLKLLSHGQLLFPRAKSDFFSQVSLSWKLFHTMQSQKRQLQRNRWQSPLKSPTSWNLELLKVLVSLDPKLKWSWNLFHKSQ